MQDLASQPVFFLQHLYIKDLSFESPRVPESFTTTAEVKVDAKVDVLHRALPLDEGGFEVSLHLVARTIDQDKRPIFVMDLLYAANFILRNIPDNLMERVLRVDAALIMFPYVSQVVADLSQRGGFPPLRLTSPNFEMMYQQFEAASQPVITH
jgi:preprotein translocase subunit SecB